MNSSRQILNLLFCALMIVNLPLVAALNFQQEFTLSSFKSEEETKNLANEFVQAADGDRDLKVVDVKYMQEKLGKDFISYNAVIKCHVSKENEDILRVQRKVVHNNKNLVEAK